MDVGGQLLFIVSQFLSNRRHCVRLNGKVSVSVDGVSGRRKVVFYDRCCLYCTPPRFSTLLESYDG